jgi:CheY-like chemotaxis protein
VAANNNPVLIVDDDEDYLLQVATHVRNSGYDVVTAGGQAEAVELLGRKTPALAIVDLMMEHNDSGFFLCHHIKRMDASIPVILVTGVTAETGIELDSDTEEERSWIKADAVLAKPIRFEQLDREVNRLMKGI